MLLCLQIWITMQPWNRVKVWQERPFGTECRLVTFKVCLDVEKLEGKVAAQIVPMHKVVLLLFHDKLYTTNANKLYILFSGSKTMFYSHICRLLTICNAIVHLSFVNYLLKQKFDAFNTVFWKMGSGNEGTQLLIYVPVLKWRFYWVMN